MLFHFPATRSQIFVSPNEGLVSPVPIFSTQWDSFLFRENCRGLVGEIIFGNSDYSTFLPEKYEVLERLYNIFSLGNSTRKREILLSQKKVYNLFLDYFSDLQKHILSSPIPENYDLLLFERKLIEDISKRDIKFSQEGDTKFLGKKILYNMYKGKTGRLVTERDSFPILGLKKELRKFILPCNDFLEEFDAISADYRAFLQIFGEKEERKLAEQIDLYQESDPEKRSQKKAEVFSLIYSKTYNDFFRKINLREKCLSYVEEENDEYVKVKTPIFKRTLKIPKTEGKVSFHLINSYIIQSVTNDSLISAIKNIYNLFSGKRSFIKCMIHDSFVIDWDKDEYEELGKIVELYIKKLPIIVYWKTKIGFNMLFEE